MISTLIISDTNDFATDYVVLRLEQNSHSYFRINRDKLHEYKISLDIASNNLTIEDDEEKHLIIGDKLGSVYYRAPTYLRESFLNDLSVENQLMKTQWMSFIRNLIVFEKARWMNNPVDTYRSENKVYQLKTAISCGFNVPKTYLTNINNSKYDLKDEFIAKSIDTVILKDKSEELFFYTNVLTKKDLTRYDISSAPIFLQEYLKDKIDIRVTIIGDKLFSCEITAIDNNIINCDWRKLKDYVKYNEIDLPLDIERKIKLLMKKMNLNFAGIDLIKLNSEFYFIEVNPTGEWAWLVDKLDWPIDEEISRWLLKK